MAYGKASATRKVGSRATDHIDWSIIKIAGHLESFNRLDFGGLTKEAWVAREVKKLSAEFPGLPASTLKSIALYGIKGRECQRNATKKRQHPLIKALVAKVDGPKAKAANA